MKILKLEPNEAPVEVEIEGSLASMQSVVGGRLFFLFRRKWYSSAMRKES